MPGFTGELYMACRDEMLLSRRAILPWQRKNHVLELSQYMTRRVLLAQKVIPLHRKSGDDHNEIICKNGLEKSNLNVFFEEEH